MQFNCGSVTPGVLKSLIPHVRLNIRTLTLGLSYSLTNDDIFSFLGELPNLKWLQLHYYWVCLLPAPNYFLNLMMLCRLQQMKRPNNLPKLLALHSFTVSYKQVYSKKDANELDKWIRCVIARSSRLQELSIVGDQQESDQYDFGAAVAHDAIVDHIVKKHAERIRVLCFRSAFVSVKALRALLGTCTNLEVCRFRVGKEALVST